MRILIYLLLFSISCSKSEQVIQGSRQVSSADELALLNPQPGDTIILKEGVWENQKLLFKGQGSEPQPVVFRASTPGKVILKGKSSVTIDGKWIVADGLLFRDGYLDEGASVNFSSSSSNCRLTNTAIVDCINPDKTRNTQYVSLKGQYNRVDHCYLKGKNNIGPTLVVWLEDHPNYHCIDHNYFGLRPSLGENGGETIRVGTSDWSMHDSYTVVENNFFEHCNGDAEIISNKSCHNTYRYNTFYECVGMLCLRHGNSGEVYGNFFFGNGIAKTGGIRIIGENHKVFNNYLQDLTGTSTYAAISLMNGIPESPLNGYYQVKKAQVVNNTIVNCTEPFEIGAGVDATRTLVPQNCTIANNIVLGTKTLIIQKSVPENLLWLGNIMFGADTGISSTDGIAVTDPKLSLAADGLWRLTSGSPAIGASSGEFSFVTEDMDGQVRDIKKDVGADQISSTAIKNKPLNRNSEVGPGWM